MTTTYDFENLLTSLQADKEITIKAKDKQNVVFPPYMVVGNGRYSKKHGVKSMDIIDVCAQLNRAENAVVKFFKDCFVDNNINQEDYPNIISPASWKTYDSYIKKGLEKNYTHLEDMQVIVRIKRGAYMLNPYLFMPRKEVLVKSQVKWEEIGGKAPSIDEDEYEDL